MTPERAAVKEPRTAGSRWGNRALYLVFGTLAVLFGGGVLLWWAYNVLIERQPHYRPGHPAFLLLWVGVFGVGTVWLRRAWRGCRSDGA